MKKTASEPTLTKAEMVKFFQVGYNFNRTEIAEALELTPQQVESYWIKGKTELEAAYVWASNYKFDSGTDRIRISSASERKVALSFRYGDSEDEAESADGCKFENAS